MLLFCNFFFLFFSSLFFFRFSSLLAPASFFRLFSAFLGLSRPFAPSSFLGKVGTFQSEFLPIFYPRHGNVFGGAKANVISITRGFAHTNTSPQHFQANIFTMPSSQFTPTFSHRDACLLFFHLLQHHWTPHLLPADFMTVAFVTGFAFSNLFCAFIGFTFFETSLGYPQYLSGGLGRLLFSQCKIRNRNSFRRNFFRLPPVPFRWAWAPPFLTV